MLPPFVAAEMLPLPLLLAVCGFSSAGVGMLLGYLFLRPRAQKQHPAGILRPLQREELRAAEPVTDPAGVEALAVPLENLIGSRPSRVVDSEQSRKIVESHLTTGSILSLMDQHRNIPAPEPEWRDPEQIPFEFRESLELAVRLLREKARTRQRELIWEIAPEIPNTFLGDPGRLRQVLLHTVGDAVETSGSPSRMREIPIRVKLLPGPPHPVKSEDNGASGKVWLKFSIESDGYGTGFRSAARLLDVQSGRVWFEPPYSGPGFTGRGVLNFTFPVSPAERRHANAQVDAGALRDLPVLVIEEQPASALQIEQFLGQAGMRPVFASSASHAWEIFELRRQTGLTFPLLLLDSSVGDADAFDVASRFLDIPSASDVRVVLMTSNGRRGDAMRCRERGIHGYLPKPIRRQELLRLIATVMALPAGGAPEQRLITRHTLRELRPPLRVLVAEDHPVNQQLVARMLEKHGHQVFVARNGLEAVEAAARERFDLILMDLQMPVMNGLKATRLIRRREASGGAGRHTPVVALTAASRPGERQLCLDAGFDEFLSKPVQDGDLLAVIDQLAPQRRESEEPASAAASGFRQTEA